MSRLGICLLVLLGLLGGCSGRMGPPAPVDFRDRSGASSQAQPPPGPHPDRMTVSGGETLYGIANRTGVPVRAIIDANNLTPPYRLLAGSTLVLPQVRAHVVRSGDTMASIARLYGVDTSSLATANHLAPPYIVRTGQTLILPAPVEAVRAPPGPAARPPPMIASAPPPAPANSVAQSTTVMPPSSAPIAVAPLPWQAASAAPKASPETAVSPPPSGLPSPQRPPPEIVASLPPASVASPPPANASPPPAAAIPAPPAAPEAAAPPPPSAPVVALSGKGFLWPVQGRVVATYGTGPQGMHNDGINIAAPAGTPVLAADAGEVAYAGNELKGYGNLVLIKHDSGFITAYAHNETLLVKRGQRVTRGQPIAKIGATGTVTEPQLHFEVRRGARVLDPMEYLPTQAATASR